MKWVIHYVRPWTLLATIGAIVAFAFVSKHAGDGVMWERLVDIVYWLVAGWFARSMLLYFQDMKE